MSSLNAEMVAKKVIAKVRKGERVNLGNLIKEVGYSDGISKQPTRITRQESYLSAIKPVVEQLEKERQRILKAMSQKDLSKEKYQTLVQSMDIVTKNTQLLGGKATDNVAIHVEISEHIANKYKNATQSASEQMADDGSTKP